VPSVFAAADGVLESVGAAGLAAGAVAFSAVGAVGASPGFVTVAGSF
jgi:hypothetical protein